MRDDDDDVMKKPWRVGCLDVDRKRMDLDYEEWTDRCFCIVYTCCLSLLLLLILYRRSSLLHLCRTKPSVLALEGRCISPITFMLCHSSLCRSFPRTSSLRSRRSWTSSTALPMPPHLYSLYIMASWPRRPSALSVLGARPVEKRAPLPCSWSRSLPLLPLPMTTATMTPPPPPTPATPTVIYKSEKIVKKRYVS